MNIFPDDEDCVLPSGLNGNVPCDGSNKRKKQRKRKSEHNLNVSTVDSLVSETEKMTKSDTEEAEESRDFGFFARFIAIGQRKTSIAIFNTYMDECVALKQGEHPFLKKVMTVSKLKKHLRRYIEAIQLHACHQSCGTLVGIEPETKISSLNEELIRSITIIAGIPKLILKEAKKRGTMAFVKHQFSDSLLASNEFGILDTCQANTCASTTTCNYVILNGDPPDEQSVHKRKPSVFCFCAYHMAFFEMLYTLFHMEWNILENCLKRISATVRSTEEEWKYEDAVRSFSPESIENMITHYMCKYNSLWACGKPEIWSATKFQLFNSRMEDDE